MEPELCSSWTEIRRRYVMYMEAKQDKVKTTQRIPCQPKENSAQVRTILKSWKLLIKQG